jgi:hypothetical protein
VARVDVALFLSRFSGISNTFWNGVKNWLLWGKGMKKRQQWWSELGVNDWILRQRICRCFYRFLCNWKVLTDFLFWKTFTWYCQWIWSLFHGSLMWKIWKSAKMKNQSFQGKFLLCNLVYLLHSFSKIAHINKNRNFNNFALQYKRELYCRNSSRNLTKQRTKHSKKFETICVFHKS